jgi:acyl dehydratase
MLEFSRRNDPWPFHVDEAAAALSPYGGIVASGGYIVTLWYRSLGSCGRHPARESHRKGQTALDQT